MQEPLPGHLHKATLDWKDLLLFAAGYVLVIVGLFAWGEVVGEPGKNITRAVIVVGILGPLGLRRLIFGAPALPEPKSGLGWSMLSMLGILVAIFGMAAAALGAYPLWDGRAAHFGLIFGGLGAVVLGAAATALRYPRSPLPVARALPRRS